MPTKAVNWPVYSHDESQICDACAGNGYVPNTYPRSAQLHPHRTCSECCGSGCATTFHQRNAA